MKRLLLFCVFSFCVFISKAQVPMSVNFDTMPDFPGGIKAYNKFLKRNLKWPSKYMDEDVQGKVIISFIVEKDGSLTHFKIEGMLRPEFDKEALRVMKKMPRWKPAMLKSKPVKCRYAVPINFTLSE